VVRTRARFRAIAAAGLALVVSGCAAVGPNYKLPAKALVSAAAAQGPFHSAGAAALDQEPPPRWWRLYDDPTLDRLVGEALAANTDLRVAAANLERAQALLAAAKAAREPDLNIGGGVNETERSAEAFVHPGPIPVGTLYDAGVSVSYDLDLFGRLRRGVEAAGDEVEVVQAARDLARVNVAAQTVQAYAEVCDAGAELAAAEQVLQLQARGADLVRRMARGGRDIAVNVARQQEVEDQIKASLPALKARRTLALYRLATLDGRPPESFEPALAACHTALRLAAPMPVGDGASLLRRRPDVRAAERRLAMATAQIGVETAALYPTVQLGASIGSTGATKDFLSPLTQRYSIGPTVTWRLNQSVPRARIAAASADARAELARFDGTVLTALRETETALTVYARDLERQTDLEAARAHAAKLDEAAHRLEAAGRTGAVAVLDADRAVALADQSLAANRTQIAQDQIAVFLALGGGWQP
jgi:NodT family efflux transporter outer membrane factor (OMF) lipoprotein